MKVLLTTPNLEKPGGVANYYAILKDHFNCQVDYLIVGARIIGEKPHHKLIRVLKDYLKFYHSLRTVHYDLVHLNPSLGNLAVVRDGFFLLIAFLLRKKIIVFIRGWDPACEKIILQRFLRLFQLVYFRANAFIVLASQFKSTLEELGYHRPIYVETTVIHDDIFSYTDIHPVELRRGDKGVSVLFLTRAEKAKGIYEAINAFKIVKAKYPFVKMVVAGDGSELENLKVYVKSYGIDDVKFVGWVSGECKYNVFANADIYLFPSWREGMPNSVLEAMACGLPVITRSVGGVADFFEDGKMGFLTESKDPCVFAELLERLITNEQLRRQMGDYNRSYAYAHFRASQVAKRLVNIYSDVMNESDRPNATGVNKSF